MKYVALECVPFPIQVVTVKGKKLSSTFQNAIFHRHFRADTGAFFIDKLILSGGPAETSPEKPTDWQDWLVKNLNTSIEVGIPADCLFTHKPGFYRLHIARQDEETLVLTYEVLSPKETAKPELQQVVDRMLELAVVLDFERKIQYVSPSVFASYGYRAEDLLGKSILELIHPDDLDATLLASTKLRRETRLRHFNNRLRHASGHFVPVSMSIHWDARLQQSTCIIRDDSELKQLQSDLHRLNSEYVDLMELSPLPLWIYEVDTLRIIKVNQAALAHYGYTREEFLKLTLYDLRPVIEYPLLERAIEKLRNTEYGHTQGQYLHKTKSGKEIQVEVRGSITYLGGKKCEIIIANDVTKLLESNKQLEAQSRHLSSINALCWQLITGHDWMESLNKSFPVLAKALDADRAYYFELHNDVLTDELLISQKLEWTAPGIKSQLANSDLQNLPASLVQEFMQKIETDAFYSAITPLTKIDRMRELLESQQILSFCMVPVYNAGVLKGLIGFDDCHNYRHWSTAEISYLRAISNIIEQAYTSDTTRSEVKNLDLRLNSMINHLPGVAYRCKADAQWTTTFLSKQFEAMTGYTADLLLEHKLFFADMIHPDDLAISYAYMDFTNDEGVFELEYRLINASGDTLFVQDKGTVFYTADGEPDYIEGILFDITKSHQQREEVDKSLERLELVFRASNEAICDWDIVNDHCIWGNGFADIFGYDLSIYNNQLWSENIHPDDKNSVIQALALFLADPKQEIFYMEYRFLRANGEAAYIQHRGIFQRNSAGKALRAVCSYRDVSDIRASEFNIQLKNNQLKEIAWMQSHQLRAPLARIMAILQLIELEGRLGDNICTEFKHIMESAAELDDLIKSVVNKTMNLPLN